ncbi:MAG: thiamine phosphate synthase [Acidobacteria bacterium]|nr:MAG: thiamine phosphate synthase [Acidobacteriota bacterium]
MRLDLPPIYPITDKRLSGRSTHREILRELIRGGARLVQIRDRETPVAELLDDLRRSVELAERHGTLLVVNDRADLALVSGACGVHLGQHDLPPKAARRVLGPRRIIGYSTHTLGQVRAAARLPVDYIGFGPVYRTATKTDAARVVGLDGLARACRIASVAVVAIGGIGLSQVRETLEAGAESVAVISALMRAPSLSRQMELFLDAATGTR